MLNWTRDHLAEKSGTAAVTIVGFEHSKTDPKISTLQKWKRALTAAGLLFIEDDGEHGPGIRQRDSEAKLRKRAQ